jgi:AcrR family transcriptional regulator
MKVSTQADPRANQKARTRQALVAAAAELLKAGSPPTVAEAAERAKVSRATAYRYFPTQESLLVEVSQVNPAAAPMEDWLAALQGGEPEERLRQLLARFNRLALQEEVALRTGLRVYLDTWLESRRQGAAPPAVREGRRMRWLDETLAPVRARLRPAQWKRLRAALALTLGAEAMVVMKDVCHASDPEALATLEWTALTLLQAALDEGAKPAGPAARPEAVPPQGSRTVSARCW